MTKIVGTIRDVHLAGATSTLAIWSGFRATTVSVIAPRRRVWEVENGVLPDGIVVAPGPAVIQIDAGVSAFKSWPVEIPDTEQVTIQELLFRSLTWEPSVPMPPPDEVADLLQIIAETAEQYRLALGVDIETALSEIAAAVVRAQQAVVDGEGQAEVAEGHMAAALLAAQEALEHAERALALVGQADEALASTQALRDEAAGVQAQIEALNAQIGVKADSIDAAVADGLAAASAAADSAAQASTLAGEAASINTQIAGHLATAQAAVAEGERQVLWAQQHAGAAEDKAQEASDYADQAATIVANAGDALASTEAARDAAQAALTTIEGIGTEVDQIQTQVLALHTEVLERHDEVLVAHGEAITAASNAASAAGTAASEASAAAADAATAADKALEATQAHAAALAVQGEVNDRLTEAVQAAADAAGSAGEAATKALEATQAQQAINAMQQQINADLVAVDALHGEVLDRHDVVLAKHSEAIDAAAAAASSAGTAATAASNAAAAASDAATEASAAAAEALSASRANADAQATFAQQQEQFNEDYAERTQLQAMMLEAVRQAQAAAEYERWHIVTAQGQSSGGDSNLSIASGRAASVTAHGSWVGRIVIHAQWYTSSSTPVEGGRVTDDRYPSRMQEFPIPNAGSRTVLLADISGTRRWVRADYTIDPAEQRVATTEVGRFVATEGVVTTIPDHTFTAGAGGRDYTATFNLTWPHANFLERFTIRIYLNSNVIAEFSQFNIGPLFGEGARTRSITATNFEMQSGDQLTFRVATSGGGNQLVTDPSSTRVTWIQGG